MEAIFLFAELHIDTCTQLNVHCFKYWFLVSRCRKIFIISYAKCTNFLYINEINNEIWVFLERNTKRKLVHFKRNTGQGQLGCRVDERLHRNAVGGVRVESGHDVESASTSFKFCSSRSTLFCSAPYAPKAKKNREESAAIRTL